MALLLWKETINYDSHVAGTSRKAQGTASGLVKDYIRKRNLILSLLVREKLQECYKFPSVILSIFFLSLFILLPLSFCQSVSHVNSISHTNIYTWTHQHYLIIILKGVLPHNELERSFIRILSCEICIIKIIVPSASQFFIHVLSFFFMVSSVCWCLFFF